MSSLRLTPDLEQAVEAEIAPGERVAWGSQPVPSRLALQGLPAFLFGLPWTAFVLFWTWMAAAGLRGGDVSAGSVGFALFGVPFVLVGLGLLSTPCWGWRATRRSLYLVTDRRAVAFTAKGLHGLEVRSFAPEQLRRPRRRQRPDGSGDLIFTRDQWRDGDGDARGTDVGFLAVPDVRAAEASVRTLAAPEPARAEAEEAMR